MPPAQKNLGKDFPHLTDRINFITGELSKRTHTSTHTHTHIFVPDVHSLPNRTNLLTPLETGVNHALKGGLPLLPQERGTNSPAAPSALRPPFTSPGLVGNPRVPSEAGARRTSRARLPAAARTRRSRGSSERTPRSAGSPPGIPGAALRPPRSLPHPRGTPQSPWSSPTPLRRETAPRSHLQLLSEKGRRREGGERENLYEWKRDRPQTFPRVFLEQPRRGGEEVTEKLVLQRRKRLSP